MFLDPLINPRPDDAALEPVGLLQPDDRHISEALLELMHLVNYLLALLEQKQVALIAVRVHQVDHLIVDEQERAQVPPLHLVDVAQLLVRRLVRLVRVFHVADRLVVERELRLDDLTLEVKREKNVDLVGEGMAIVYFYVTVDVEKGGAVQNVGLKLE